MVFSKKYMSVPDFGTFALQLNIKSVSSAVHTWDP